MPHPLSSVLSQLQQLTQSKTALIWSESTSGRWQVEHATSGFGRSQQQKLADWQEHQALLSRCQQELRLEAELSTQADASATRLILIKHASSGRIVELMGATTECTHDQLAGILNATSTPSNTPATNICHIPAGLLKAFLTAESPLYRHHLLVKLLVAEADTGIDRLWAGLLTKAGWESLVANDVWPVEPMADLVRQIQTDVYAQSADCTWKRVIEHERMLVEQAESQRGTLLRLTDTRIDQLSLLYLLESGTEQTEQAISCMAAMLIELVSPQWLGQLSLESQSVRERKRSRIAIASLGIIAFACVVLFLIPVPMRILATGVLQPSKRSVVFAPWEGIIKSGSLKCEFGSQLQQGDRICEMESLDLKLQAQQYSGELATTVQQLEAAKANRLSVSSSSDVKTSDPLLLSARIQELEASAANLTTKLNLIQEQLAQADILAPISGKVITRDLKTELDNRPVRRGDPLLMVADYQGPWEVVLEFDESELRYVQQALDAQQQLRVHVSLLSRPDVVYQAMLGHLEPLAVHKTEAKRSVVAACLLEQQSRAKAEQAELAGVSVLGRVDCESTTLGNWLSYRLLDSLRQRWSLWWAG